MKYSVIQYKEVQEHIELRLEAEYFSPEFVELYNTLDYLNAKPFGEYVDEIRCGPFGSTILCDTYDKDGIIVARPFNIKDCTIENTNLAYITETDCINKGLKLYRKGDIFFSRVGDIRCGIVPELKNNITISPNIIAVRTNPKKLNPYYIAIFFNTKYGFMQLLRNIKVVAQPTIPTEIIHNLKIIIPSENFQNQIANLFKYYFSKSSKAMVLYKDSEDIFLKALNLSNWHPKHELSYVKNFSDVNSANRYDAEYFQPKYDEILEIINKNNHTTLIEQFDIIRNSGLEYDSEGKNGVIKTKQLKECFIDFNVEDRTNQGDSSTIVKDRDVLFASMGVGSLGKTNIYYNFENEGSYIIDSTLKIFRAKIGGNISPEYLEIYLHSRLAQELIYQNIVGSSGIISIYESYLQNLPIPIIDKKTEEQIIKNIRNAHLFNYQSKQLLEIAKRGVEIAIEENEDISTNWINEQLLKLGINLN